MPLNGGEQPVREFAQPHAGLRAGSGHEAGKATRLPRDQREWVHMVSGHEEKPTTERQGQTVPLWPTPHDCVAGTGSRV